MKRPQFLLLILALAIMALTVACVRPLREEEATDQPAAPALETPAGELVVPTVAPDAGTEAPEGEGPATEQPATEADGGDATNPDQSGSTDDQPSASTVVYVVQAGDTLNSVAARYNLTADQLAAANNLTLDAGLVAGQQLVIPVGTGVSEQPAEQPTTEAPTDAPRTTEIIHVVQPGENLFRIGLRYGIPYQELAAYNNIPNPALIDVGQEIRIPPEQ
ncbi:MAG: LysM peptidoglycan-binding domain-containing protein [Candidatus Promineifilaceae bacterium]|nr:LysM peptidoglycan-binding domain-containing protein [Candidatus Promineifilaceae bacterium]